MIEVGGGPELQLQLLWRTCQSRLCFYFIIIQKPLKMKMIYMKSFWVVNLSFLFIYELTTFVRTILAQKEFHE